MEYIKNHETGMIARRENRPADDRVRMNRRLLITRLVLIVSIVVNVKLIFG
ncbi:MAG: hypothetical protein ACE3JK_13600 [Sporolactobacillus sp.]